jgi:hypothetical protein
VAEHRLRSSWPTATSFAVSATSSTSTFVRRRPSRSRWRWRHWRSEAVVARINAADAFAPSMRQNIDIADIHAKALRALPEIVDGVPPLPVPDVCPVTLDELLGD